ncbi:cytochrome c oxidase subunit II [Thalassococcus profundi]|uniref:Cytochrome aa3 subunit 2 n=1 Tax=Thalassococcus profundi TaxID=2282382 RepID=A0A369THE1_9RHOB|nr:cytochrome c oxidase subunit II [Thalassococcus profundi]RDD64650.1 cytochrome c oxidase subunit II [Thalassococcus profundi]
MNGETTLGRFDTQTALVGAGTGAEMTLVLTVVMTVAAAVIFVAVMGVAWWAWRRETNVRPWWVWTGGVVVPVITLALLVVGSSLTLAAIGEVDEEPAVIEVTGHQYWWDVIHDPRDRSLRDANEIVLPVDQPVTLRLKSEDVIHSFWVPSISGKMDMIPGRTNALTVTATRIGRFRGQCAEFCGLSHPLMAFEVVVVSTENYAAYLDGLETEARDADTLQRTRGRDVFIEAGCPACHAIRGVAEGARIGPDLTRVGGRASLGAGMWAMNVGNLAGWIADVQDMKPGAQMPSYNHLSGPDLRAVAHYLESLK